MAILTPSPQSELSVVTPSHSRVVLPKPIAPGCAPTCGRSGIETRKLGALSSSSRPSRSSRLSNPIRTDRRLSRRPRTLSLVSPIRVRKSRYPSSSLKRTMRSPGRPNKISSIPGAFRLLWRHGALLGTLGLSNWICGRELPESGSVLFALHRGDDVPNEPESQGQCDDGRNAEIVFIVRARHNTCNYSPSVPLSAPSVYILIYW